jgi:hypothetical protein
MPKATAVWLVDNTTLTFDQIAKLCQLHSLEIQAIANDEVSSGIIGLDPTFNGQLTREEIARCETDPNAELKLVIPNIPISEAKPKGARYTPISKRNDKPDAIAWLLKNQEDLSDAQIGRLVGTTKSTINAVRDRSHWNSSNLRPRHPVELGLCRHTEIDAEIAKARKRKNRQTKKSTTARALPATEAPVAEAPVHEEPAQKELAPEDAASPFSTLAGSPPDSAAEAQETESTMDREALEIPEETPEESPQDDPAGPPEIP